MKRKNAKAHTNHKKKHSIECFFDAVLPIFAVVDFHVVVILKVLLFVALSFVAMAFQLLTCGFFRLGGRGVVLDFVYGGKSCFFVVHIVQIVALSDLDMFHVVAGGASINHHFVAYCGDRLRSRKGANLV